MTSIFALRLMIISGVSAATGVFRLDDPATRRLPNKDLSLRVGSAIVLGVPALIAGWLGGLVFMFAMVGLAGFALQEWLRLTGMTAWPWLTHLSLIALLPITLAFFWGYAAFGSALLLLVGAMWVMAEKKRAGWAIAGLLYVAVPTISLVILRGRDSESFWPILFLFLVVWATDILAFFGGRAIGGPKLWPRVSPGKTWAGALSGLMCSVLLAILLWVWVDNVSIGAIIGVAAALSVAAQCGDLLESALKRHFKIKDSGKLIPGHGGVLDRVDGLYGAATLALFLVAVGIGGPLSP